MTRDPATVEIVQYVQYSQKLLNASRIRTPIAKLMKSIESEFDRGTLSVSVWMHRDFQMCIMHGAWPP